MNKKPVRAGMAGETAARPDAMQQKPLRSEATMHTDTQVRKAGGRLSREDQRRLGDILQRVYDEVLRQGVPDRFKDLLDQFDKNVGDAETAAMPGQAGGEHAPNRLVGAKAFDNKGSRS
jgi:hypothetical protein